MSEVFSSSVLEAINRATTYNSDYVDPSTLKVIVIDGETRNMTIPEGENLFGARGDKNVERKYFQCPKIVGDNIDLSQHLIYVNYVFTDINNTTNLPETNIGMYHCEDVAVEGDNITFSWLLSGNVLHNPGFIAFKVCAKEKESDPTTVFNTTPAIGIVLYTIPDGSEIIPEEYPDIITQLLADMDATKEEVAAQIARIDAIKDQIEGAVEGTLINDNTESNIFTYSSQKINTELRKKATYYDSVASMKADSSLKDGSIAVTLGYYSENDGGGAVYLIDNKETNYSGINIQLNNNIYANIITKGYINVLTAGVKNDGITPTSDKINSLLKNLKFNKLYFPSGVYLLDKKLICRYSTDISLIGNSSQSDNYYNDGSRNNTIFTITDNYNDNCLIESDEYTRVSIKNILFYGKSYKITCDDQISTTGNIHNMYTETTIIEGLSGIILKGAQNFIDNCFFDGFSDNGVNSRIYNNIKNCIFKNCRIGIQACIDNIISNIIVFSCKTGILIGAGQNIEDTSLNGTHGGSNNLSIIRIDGCSKHGIEIYGFSNNLSNYMSDQINYSSILLTGSGHTITNALISRSAQYTAGNEMPENSNEQEKYCCIFLKDDCGNNHINFIIRYIAGNDLNIPNSKTPSFAICSNGYLNNNFINVIAEGINEITKIINCKGSANSIIIFNGLKYELSKYINNDNYIVENEAKSRNVKKRNGLFYGEGGYLYVYNEMSESWIKIG